MNSKHLLRNGKQFWLASFTGVAGSQAHGSYTTVHQDAPRVIGRALVPGALHSETHSTHKVWLTSSTGVERQFDLSDVQLPIRDGHTVTVVWGAVSGTDAGYNLAAKNETTGEVAANASSALSGSRLKASGVTLLSLGFGKVSLGTMATGLILGGVFGPENGVGLVLGLIAGCVVGFFADFLKIGASISNLEVEIDDICRARLATPPQLGEAAPPASTRLTSGR